MSKDICFSIVMPTYNSEATIEKALQSIRMQDLDSEEIEILVIDGGSTDRTIEIAQKYGAIILENPNRTPEYAKRIGFAAAKGRWAVMQDSDEVLTEIFQLRRRKELFEKNPNVYCLVLDKFIPGESCGVACAYVNWFGDPFSYVVYGLSDSRVKDNRRYLCKSDKSGNIYAYTRNDIIPIGDGGTATIDIHKAKELFGKEYYMQEFAVSIFYRMVERTGYVGCIPDDNIVHYSSAKFNNYLKKLRFRVYTNLNDVKQSGYTVRSKNNKVLHARRYLFILYAISVFAPILDSIKMCIRYKRIELLLHFVYTYYVVFELIIGVFRKVLKVQKEIGSYG